VGKTAIGNWKEALVRGNLRRGELKGVIGGIKKIWENSLARGIPRSGAQGQESGPMELFVKGLA